VAPAKSNSAHQLSHSDFIIHKKLLINSFILGVLMWLINVNSAVIVFIPQQYWDVVHPEIIWFYVNDIFSWINPILLAVFSKSFRVELWKYTKGIICCKSTSGR
jgi:hypothetical protein